MRMAARNGITGVFLMGLAQSTLAQIAVAGFPIPGHIESATKGHFVELTLAIANEAKASRANGWA
jgi:hypothetical protein